MSKISEAVESYWGEQCSDFEEWCPTCQAWKEIEHAAEALNIIQFYADDALFGNTARAFLAKHKGKSND